MPHFLHNQPVTHSISHVFPSSPHVAHHPASQAPHLLDRSELSTIEQISLLTLPHQSSDAPLDLLRSAIAVSLSLPSSLIPPAPSLFDTALRHERPNVRGQDFPWFAAAEQDVEALVERQSDPSETRPLEQGRRMKQANV